jgi:hypothetical protein
MKWRYTLPIIFSLFVFSNLFALADNATLFGKIEHNQLDTSLLNGKANAINCPQQANYTQAISKLLAGYDLSTVFRGSAQNDVLKSSMQNNLLKSAAQQDSNTPTTKTLDTKIKTVRTIQDILANHDLAIIVDRSGSMSTQDCPGGLSRWQWCSKQAAALAQAAAQASSAITVMFFNNELQIFDNVSPANLPILFNSYSPAGGTALATPLVAQLDRYFSRRSKPLIIVVISDGIPQDTSVLAPMISDASNSLHYVGEVTISFLLIGNQIDSQQFKSLLGELDGGGIKNGGMVDVIDFKTLSAKGIKQTLFDELKTITLATNKSKPSKAEQFAVGRSLNLNQPLNPFPMYSSNAVNALTNPFPKASLAAAKIYAKSK